MNTRPLLHLLFVPLFWLACSPSDDERAQLLLQQAQTAYNMQAHHTAQLFLDSIQNQYPRAIHVRQQAQQLKYHIQMASEQRILQTTDSLLQFYNAQIDSVINQHFEYVKSEYDVTARFVPKGTDPGENPQRSYIHAAVCENGTTQLFSTYAGTSSPGHTTLLLNAGDGTSSRTASIAYNDGANYQYKILDTYYETVTYEGEKDGGTLAFAAIHAHDKSLSALLTGGKRDCKIPISDKDRTALAMSYELGHMMQERVRLQQEHRTAEMKVQWLAGKIH